MGHAGRALCAHIRRGTTLPMRGQVLFMMRHEIPTAGIFALKPTRKEVRHVKTVFFCLFVFFLFKSKTGNVEKQQSG